MPAKVTVLQSVNQPGETVCVDVFVRPDGTYGFDEFRRDLDGSLGWFSIGHHGDRVYESQATASQAAKQHVRWFAAWPDIGQA